MLHRFKLLDQNIVLDVNSGSVHVFDDLSYEILDLIEKGKSLEEIYSIFNDKDSSLIKEVIDEIILLKESGSLNSPKLNFIDTSKMYKGVKALCLHIAHDCNMKCKYCFASSGDYRIKRTLMSFEVGKKAIDFVIKNSNDRKNIEVDFFGGEPLMNFNVVKEIVEYARSKEKEFNKNFRFTITTNGLLLNDDNMEFINKNISNIVLSIDGRKSVNDNMRSCVTGEGSYDIILPKIKEMVKRRKSENYYVRGTFTRDNLDFSNDVLHLANEGFDQISVEPVVANKDSNIDLREEDLPKIFDEYEKLAIEYVKRNKKGKGFNFFHFMMDLDGGPCGAKRVYGCGAGFDYVAVTPEGDIYPCHQFVGVEDFKIGNIDSGITNMDVCNKFVQNNVDSKTECIDCWAKYLCSGGCNANGYFFEGDISKPYSIACKLQKKRIECALWIKTQEV